ncbi:MAG TPA: DedA family protein [Candidatus Helicobacter avistercoris]|nr:DedA family protein [Candidatus Helicobacter avistercoris]
MQIILEKIEVYGYLILYFSSFGGSFLGIMGAGILSSFGKLDLMLSILIASCGNISGSMIIAYLARFNKRFFIAKKWKRKRAIVSCWFRRYGGYVFLLSKYIYAIKSLVPIAIGLSSYPLWKFWLWNTGASLLWGVIMGCVGYFASEAIVQALQNQWGYVLASIAICGAFVGILIAKRRFNARRTSCIQ